MDKKKVYSTPRLIVHGDVEKITQQGNAPNADAPQGNNNTAYPPAGSFS